MTTLPHTLLSEQEICDAFLEAKAVQPTLAQELRIGRTIESKAIAAYAAKLAQGVELEGFRLTWHSDQARYTVSKPNIDTMDVVPVSTAQAAVAAAILQEREALNDEAADMVVRLQDEKEAAVAAERVKTQAAVNTLQTIAEMPIPEQDNMVAANMRRVAQSMFVQPIAASPAPAAEPTGSAEMLDILETPGDLKTAAAALCVLAEWWSDRMERPWSVPMPRVVLPALEAAGGGEG